MLIPPEQAYRISTLLINFLMFLCPNLPGLASSENSPLQQPTDLHYDLLTGMTHKNIFFISRDCLITFLSGLILC